MAKKTAANHLPQKVRTELENMCEQIKLARKRRGLSIRTMAQRVQCSELTIIRAERGIPTVSVGVYARILYGLGLDEDLLLIARNDPAGNTFVNARILKKNEKKQSENILHDYD